MTPEQKQRAIDLLACFDEKESYEETRYVEAFALLQELIDAPEQAGVPVCRVSGYFGGYLIVETIDKAAVLPNGMALYAAPQAPAVQADMVSSDDLAKLLPYGYYMDPPDGGSPTVLEQVARMAEDAARYRYLRNDCAGFDIAVAELDRLRADKAHVTTMFESTSKLLNNAIDLVEKKNAQLVRLRAIKSAAENLKRAKGRHNSEIAMNKLLEALK